MNNHGVAGVTAITLLGGVVIASAASSVVLQSSETLSSTADQMINDIIKGITTYLSVDDIMGKYYITNGTRQVERIVLLLKQPVKSPLDLSEITLKLSNNDDVILLQYSGHAAEYNSKGMFDNQVWETMNDTYGVIIVHDKDHSVTEYHVMNDDIIFLAIQLPSQFTMGDGESITIAILPDNGIITTLVLETPTFHISNILDFKNP
jgi:archaellin